MAKTVKVSIIIPVFNQAALTKQCLETILGRAAAEIIVVNDASTDGTAKMLAAFGDKIKVVTHKTNGGFAKSCNDGAAAAHGKFLVFLNNDTIPQRGWLDALVGYAEKNPKAAVVGAKLLYPNNTVQHAGVIICQDKYPRHIYTGFPAKHPAVSQSRRFQIVTAAAMLVRKNIFAVARGFDTKFRNGFEDVDFCLRLGERGHEIHYCAESVVQHLESVSPNRFKRDKHNVALYRRRWLVKVQPDDLKFFLEDGLLEVNYEGHFPLHLKVAPELAVLDAARGGELEKSLATKSRQVADLTREVTKLRAELDHQNPASQSTQADRAREGIREQVRLATPPDAKILVVSKGDSALLELDGRDAQHFPQTESGVYLGHHPADSADAIARLDALRARGAEYVLFPATAFWWLEHYAEFARHIEAVGSLVQRNQQCVIYSLRRLTLAKPKKAARVIALLATHNEERFIANCLTHLIAQGLQVHLIDNGSTDRTVAIAKTFLGRGLRQIEHLPHTGTYSLPMILRRKEELAVTLDADWILHADADEIPLAPRGELTLAEAIGAADAAGFNIINFIERTFLPTHEAPAHDHADFQKTMRWYYPFAPQIPWHLRAWKKTGDVSIAHSGGHLPRFAGMRMCPDFFILKHYQFLSVAHALEKYGRRRHDPAALKAGLHGGENGWRNRFGDVPFALPAQSELREFVSDSQLEASNPRTQHFLHAAILNRATQT